MDISSSIAIFLTLSMTLLGLFCFVTKYLHNRIKRNLQDKNGAHSIEDELYDTSQQDQDFDRSNYKMKYGSTKNRSGSKINLEIDDDVSYKSRLKGNDDQIYKPNTLRSKLSTSALQLDGKQETTRSMASQKSFRPQKMNTQRGNNEANKANQDLIKHTYISKLLKYDFSGIAIMDIALKVIRKTIDGQIKQNKKVHFHAFITTDQMFKTQLQNLGIQQGSFGCFKEESTISIIDSKEETVHRVDEMKISQSRKEITEYQYEKYKKQIKDECSLE